MATAPQAPQAPTTTKVTKGELKAVNTIIAHDGKKRVTFKAGDVVKGLSAESMKNLKDKGLVK